MPDPESSCPLCALGPDEVQLHASDEFLILRTKFMKGHRERFMVCLREHTHPRNVPDDLKARGLAYLRAIALARIGNPPGFILLEDRHSSIPHHWHQVCMDLLEGEDYAQVVDTPRTLFTPEHPQGVFLDAGEAHEPLKP